MINHRIGAQATFIQKAEKHECYIYQCNICEKSFIKQHDPDAHVEDMPDVTK